jgi:hypothetical protein
MLSSHSPTRVSDAANQGGYSYCVVIIHRCEMNTELSGRTRSTFGAYQRHSSCMVCIPEPIDRSVSNWKSGDLITGGLTRICLVCGFRLRSPNAPPTCRPLDSMGDGQTPAKD